MDTASLIIGRMTTREAAPVALVRCAAHGYWLPESLWEQHVALFHQEAAG